MKYHVGDYKREAASEGLRGWLVGSFMEIGPRKTNDLEIKYWEFEAGPTQHETKISTTFECTFILEGEVVGTIDGQEFTLTEGQYVTLPPGTSNNLVKLINKKSRGLTIKAPSDPNSKKVLT